MRTLSSGDLWCMWGRKDFKDFPAETSSNLASSIKHILKATDNFSRLVFDAGLLRSGRNQVPEMCGDEHELMMIETILKLIETWFIQWTT